VSAYRHWLSGLLAGAVLVAAVTAVIWALEPHVPVLSLSVLYLFAVLPVAVFWGLPFAIATSVATMLAFNFYFLPPTHTLTLQDSRNWFALGVFLVTSVVVSELEARSRKRATEAALLAEIAGSLLERGDVTESSSASHRKPPERSRSRAPRSSSGHSRQRVESLSSREDAASERSGS
jgi:K+-sensing histidine kinase KdpD